MLSRRTQLHYFITVAEEGQITRAAQKLHLAQAALSQVIAQLECELGVRLLRRNARGVTLTNAGEAFLDGARATVAAKTAAAQTAESLARAARGTIEVGFIGPPPAVSDPELFAAFADIHRELQISFRELPFPRGATVDWIAEVDVAICHPPLAEKGICVQPVRVEPRALVAHEDHPLARQPELALADVLDETFVSYHPEVQSGWAGFHSLDDHRGGQPAHLTSDQARTSLQMLAIMTSGGAVTTVPCTDASLAQQVLPSVAVRRLDDAEPAIVSLIWRSERPNPLVTALVTTAQRLTPCTNGV